MTATVKDCAAMLAKHDGISKVEAEKRIKSVVEVIASQCVEKGGVSFKGVFTIKVKIRKGRSGCMKGKDWTTQDKKTLTIAVGSGLNAELNPDASE